MSKHNFIYDHVGYKWHCTKCDAVNEDPREGVDDLNCPGITSRELIKELVEALDKMVSHEIHDALCQAYEGWENPHEWYEQAEKTLNKAKAFNG